MRALHRGGTVLTQDSMNQIEGIVITLQPALECGTQAYREWVARSAKIAAFTRGTASSSTPCLRPGTMIRRFSVDADARYRSRVSPMSKRSNADAANNVGTATFLT